MSCTSTLYNVMQVMTHGHSTASGSSPASLSVVHDVQTRVSSLSRTSVVCGHDNVFFFDNAATCAIIPKDNGRVADCIERADHFWTLRSDEE